MNQTRKAFDYIRRTFFPRWTRGKKWRVRVISNMKGYIGRCNRRTKVITLKEIPGHDTASRELLIHEIVHAVTFGGHTTPWRTRMEGAAKRARRLDMRELAEAIDKDLNPEIPKDAVVIELTPQMVYNDMEDAVMQWMAAHGSASLSGITMHFGEQYGLTVPEFRRQFPRYKAVFNEAVQTYKLYLRSRKLLGE